jgi:hypothetical protein
MMKALVDSPWPLRKHILLCPRGNGYPLKRGCLSSIFRFGVNVASSPSRPDSNRQTPSPAVLALRPIKLPTLMSFARETFYANRCQREYTGAHTMKISLLRQKIFESKESFAC